MISVKLCPNRKKCEVGTDEELVELTKTNKECYVCLIDRYEKKIIRYIRRISGVSVETAEDIAQDVFLKAYVNLKGFKKELKFSSWLYRIAHNETINYWRRNKKRSDNDISWDDNDALKNIIRDDKNVEQEVYQKVTNEQLLKTLDRLDEKYKTVLVLNYLEGQSYREIADVLKKPIGTVGTLLSRAKKMLKKKLIKEGITSSVANK